MATTGGLEIDTPTMWDKVAVLEPHPGFPDYPDLHVVGPINEIHKSTLILLHGTSTDGPSFASSILNFRFPAVGQYTLDGPYMTSLPQILPYTRFVFPTGRPRETTVFGGKLTNAWFDIHDFSDRTIGENESAIGMRESYDFLKELISYERERLMDPYPSEPLGIGQKQLYGKVALGGFSQGAAMTLIMALTQDVIVDGFGLNGYCCLSGWLPFRKQILETMEECELKGKDWKAYSKKVGKEVANTIRGILGAPRCLRMLGTDDRCHDYVEGRFFFAHGNADKKVKYEWGIQARDVFLALGSDYVHKDPPCHPPNPWGTREVGKEGKLKVTWTEVEGLGHWYSEQELEALVAFLDDPEVLVCQDR